MFGLLVAWLLAGYPCHSLASEVQVPTIRVPDRMERLLRDIETQTGGKHFRKATFPAVHAFRFYAVYNKLSSGIPIVVAGVGGSITAGNRVAKNETYGHMVVKYLQEHFPTSTSHRYVQVGCPARDSSYFHVCLHRAFDSKAGNITMREVDLWLLETAANDVVLVSKSNNHAAWAHVEAVVRGIQSRSPGGAIAFVWFAAGFDNRWSNTQEHQRKVATHYDLPGASWLTLMHLTGGYRDKMKQLLLADGRTHPTALGHKVASNLVVYMLLHTLRNIILEVPGSHSVPPLDGGFQDDPEPLCIPLSPTFSHWNVTENRGFVFGGMKPGRVEGLVSHFPGATATLAFNTTTANKRIFLGVARTWQCTRHNPPFCPGKATLVLDGSAALKYDARSNAKYSVVGPLALGDVGSGPHSIRVTATGKSGNVLISGIFGYEV